MLKMKLVLVFMCIGCNCNHTSSSGFNGMDSEGKNDSMSPNVHSKVTTLYLLSLLPYPDFRPTLQPSWEEGPTLVLAAQLAVELINNRSDILTNYNIELIAGDSGCDVSTKTITAFVNHVLHSGKQIVGIVGPGCSASGLTLSPLNAREPLSLVNVHIAGSLTLFNRTKYPNSFGTLDSTQVFVKASLALMKKNNWKRVAAFYDESRPYYYSTLLKIQNIKNKSVTVFTSAVYSSHVPFDALQQEKMRIVFLLVGPDLLGKILCLAYQKGMMYPDYQWIVVSRTLEEATPAVSFLYAGKLYSCTREEMYTAVHSSLILHYRLDPINQSMVTDSGLTYKEFLQQYNQRVHAYNTHHPKGIIAPSVWAASYFDAVWSLALALNNSIDALYGMGKSLSDYHYGQHTMTEIIRNRFLELDFEGASGKISYDWSSGYVVRIVNIYKINNGRSTLVAYFNGSQVMGIGAASFINDTFPSERIFTTVPTALWIGFLSLAGIIFLLFVVMHVLTVAYRKHPSVKASSPKLTHIVFVGCYLLIVALMSFIVKWGYIQDQAYCRLLATVHYCSLLGYTCIFSTVLGKVWRIYRIFVHFHNPGKLISDWVLMVFIFLSVAVEFVPIVTWSAVNRTSAVNSTSAVNRTNSEPKIYLEFPSEQNKTVTDIVVRCESFQGSNYYIWIAVLLTYNGIIMLASCMLAILTHCYGIPQHDFKEKHVIIMAYALTVTLPLGLGIFYILPVKPKNILGEFFIMCFLLTTAVSLSFFCLVFPPIFKVLKNKVHSTKLKVVVIK